MQTQEVTVADGRVESADNGIVVGWAWSPAEAQTRVQVDLWVDGQLVASGPADQHAPGLKEAGIGDGNHAFAIELPAKLAREEEIAVAVRVAGVSQRLAMLAGWNEPGEGASGDEDAGGGEWARVRMVVDDRPPTAPMADEPPPTSPEPAIAALAGRGGWLFAGTPSAEDRVPVEVVAAELQQTAEELAGLAIRYVVAVAPPKLAVYPDRLLQPAVAARPSVRALDRFARDSDVLEILDLREALADARRHGDVFLPRDEGWSALGALHVQRTLVKRAGIAGLRPTAIADARFAPALEPPPAALADLPLAGDTGDDADPEPPLAVDASWLRAVRVPAARHLEIEDQPGARVYERPGGNTLPRVVLAGDPCINAIVPWMAEISSRLIVFPARVVPKVAIELEYPAVVFHVLEERRIGV